jgi:Spy/CpxP family protein refolding chaperone
MYPAIVYVWGARRVAAGSSEGVSCGGGRGYSSHGCGSSGDDHSAPPDCGDGDGGGGGGGSFGVRRPLRFLAYKLDLDEKQVAELARILNELKTERAQAEVDNRRTVTAFADAVVGDSFDGAKAEAGAKLRVDSAVRLRDAVLKALAEIHKLLNTEQRAKLAYLIRTGTLSL